MPKTSARLLALLSLLQARRDWPGTLLAERLEVSARTVRRDVDRLRELGYPIVTTKGPDGGYRLGAGSRLPPLLFDDEQAVALTVALQLATTRGRRHRRIRGALTEYDPPGASRAPTPPHRRSPDHHRRTTGEPARAGGAHRRTHHCGHRRPPQRSTALRLRRHLTTDP
jgi:predicted DNA-binding transcriptional regulator YafY